MPASELVNWENAAGVLIMIGVACYQIWLLRAVLFHRREKQCTISATLSYAHDLLPSNHHDCDFGLLWETQKEVLELLDDAGERGVTLEDLAERYRLLGLHYPELCEGIPFLDWLRWMQEAQLISCDDGLATIAEMGRFILYDLDRNHAFADHRCV